MSLPKKLPTLLSERPPLVQLVLVGVVPVVGGFLCGLALDVSGGLFLAMQAPAIAGGYLGGLEHSQPSRGAGRGAVGGVLFGASILLGYAATGSPHTEVLPDPEQLQVVITTGFGVLLGALGARSRSRRALPAELEADVVP